MSDETPAATRESWELVWAWVVACCSPPAEQLLTQLEIPKTRRATTTMAATTRMMVLRSEPPLNLLSEKLMLCLLSV
jgi:hypothetical protein